MISKPIQRNKWKLFQEGNYTYSRSIFGHVLSGALATELTHLANYKINKHFLPVLKFILPKDHPIQKAKANFNIAVPSADLNIGNHHFETPEIMMVEHNVSFNTAPWEWMAGTLKLNDSKQESIRNVETWNQQVDMYRSKVTKIVYELLRQYLNTEGIFRDKKKIEKAGNKELLLQNTLLNRLGANTATNQVFAMARAQLVNGVMERLFVRSHQNGKMTQTLNTELVNNLTKNKNGSDTEINAIIKQSVDSMKIAQRDAFVESRKSVLSIQEASLMAMVTEQENGKSIFSEAEQEFILGSDSNP